MHRITRIAYNSQGWRHPTGEAAMHEQKESFNSINKFGHEDWLFRDEWLIDGWRYAFIQGVGKSRRLLIEQQRPFNLTLFTVQPDKLRRYVATIQEAEVLDDSQADAAVKEFRRRGWLDQMSDEIRKVGGNSKALGNIKWAAHVLNVRFRLDNVRQLAPDTYATASDPILRLNRYQLFKLEGAGLSGATKSGRKGSTTPPDIQSFLRQGHGPIEISPEHARMQTVLMAELRKEFPGARVVREENFVDVLVETDDALRIYEIKSDLAPCTVLRQALGQLLEYGYKALPSTRKLKFIAVGRSPLSPEDKGYLSHLQQSFSLPLEYRVVSI